MKTPASVWGEREILLWFYTLCHMREKSIQSYLAGRSMYQCNYQREEHGRGFVIPVIPIPYSFVVQSPFYCISFNCQRTNGERSNFSPPQIKLCIISNLWNRVLVDELMTHSYICTHTISGNMTMRHTRVVSGLYHGMLPGGGTPSYNLGGLWALSQKINSEKLDGHLFVFCDNDIDFETVFLQSAYREKH